MEILRGEGFFLYQKEIPNYKNLHTWQKQTLTIESNLELSKKQEKEIFDFLEKEHIDYADKKSCYSTYITNVDKYIEVKTYCDTDFDEYVGGFSIDNKKERPVKADDFKYFYDSYIEN